MKVEERKDTEQREYIKVEERQEKARCGNKKILLEMEVENRSVEMRD